jgi:cyclase
MPEITFTEQFILEMKRKQVHILHTGGHSPATCMVYLPQDRLAFTGDLVLNNMHPTMSQAQSKQWLSALNKLRKMAVDVIVPGHGAVCDKTATHPLSRYLRQVRARVRKEFDAGRSKSETSKAMIPELMGAFPYKEDEKHDIQRRIKEASYRVYDEYRAAAKATAQVRSNKKRKRRRRTKKATV